jgi:probable rRNA maturation factor
MMTIEIFREGEIRFPFHSIRKGDIRGYAEKICSLLKLRNANMTLVLTDNSSIRVINKKYRKKDRPTDVISFAFRDSAFPAPGRGVEELGEVYLSLEQAWLQRDCSVSFRDEVKRLLLHGILHLIGYDHEKSKREEDRMRKMEDEILGKM